MPPPPAMALTLPDAQRRDGSPWPVLWVVSMAIALTVLLLGSAGLQRADFNAVYLCLMALAMVTAVCCLSVDTLPQTRGNGA